MTKKARVNMKQVDAIKKDIELFGNKIMPKELFKLAILLNTKIKLRVQEKGLNANLRKMEYRSGRYKNKRRLKGRQTDHKDLTFSGRMWSSLTADFFGTNSVRLYFSGREENKKAAGNDKREEFFGISPDEDSFIEKQLSKAVKEATI